MILSKLGVTIPSFFIVQAPWLKTLAPKMITLKYNVPTLPGSWWQRTAATKICFSFLDRVRKIFFAQRFKRGIKWIIYLGSCKSGGQTEKQNLEYVQLGRREEGVEDSFKTYKWDLVPSSGDSAIVLVLIRVEEFKVPPKNSGPAKKSCYYFWSLISGNPPFLSIYKNRICHASFQDFRDLGWDSSVNKYHSGMELQGACFDLGLRLFHMKPDEKGVNVCKQDMLEDVGKACASATLASPAPQGHLHPHLSGIFPAPEPLTHFLFEAHLSVLANLRLTVNFISCPHQVMWKNICSYASVLPFGPFEKIALNTHLTSILANFSRSKIAYSSSLRRPQKKDVKTKTMKE